MELNQALESLKNIRHGALALDIGDALTQAHDAIESHGGTAEVTIKLKLKQGPGGAYEVVDAVSTKLPADKRAKSSLVFPAPSGALLVTDPQQGELGFKPQEVRQVEKEEAPRAAVV